MKTLGPALLLVVSGVILIHTLCSKGADETTFQAFQTSEYATIRWQGRENTQLIRPSGKIEKLRTLLEKYPRPEGLDERAYYMNIALNALAKEGYELAGMTGDELVMKRGVPK